MRLLLLLLTVCVGCTVWALECGLGTNENEDVKLSITNCLKNNKTLESLWNAFTSSETDNSVKNDTTNPSSKSSTSQNRTKRSTYGVNQLSTNGESTTTNDTEVTSTESSTENVDANCVVQCVFASMSMTDANGLPEHQKVSDGLLKTASGRELRDFLQDTADHCFQEVNKGDRSDACDYSNKLITCLADAGKINCADWPAGNIPIF